MIKINNYLPKALQEIKEFQAINENLDIELNNISSLISKIKTETIVETATEYGINKWEKILGIISLDNESLEVRRFRIINILTSKLPYTLKWLKMKLTQIVGSESGWTLNVSYVDYTITITLSGLDTNLMLEVEKQLRNSIPANMELHIGGPSITGGNIKIGIGMSYGTKYLIPTLNQPISLTKNKLPNYIVKSFSQDGVDFIVNADKSITIKGTATKRIEPLLYDKEFVLPAGSYKYTGELFLILLNITDNVYTTANKGGTIVLTKNTTFSAVYFRVENGATVDITYHPMLIIDGQDVTYEPFIGI